MDAITTTTTTTDTVTTKKIENSVATWNAINAELDSHLGGTRTVFGSILEWDGSSFYPKYCQVDGEIVGYKTTNYILDDPDALDDEEDVGDPVDAGSNTSPSCCSDCPDVSLTYCFAVGSQDLGTVQGADGSVGATMKVSWTLGNFTRNGVAVTQEYNGSIPTSTFYEDWAVTVYYSEEKQTQQDTESCNASCPCPTCACLELGLVPDPSYCAANQQFKFVAAQNPGDPDCYECY